MGGTGVEINSLLAFSCGLLHLLGDKYPTTMCIFSRAKKIKNDDFNKTERGKK